MSNSPLPHPIVEAMHPSPEQAPAIVARGRDVVVTAGAGAGKTLTLVARYLALLAEGVPLRRIVAITFTEKAGREMRNRVRDEVRRYLETPGLDAEEHACWSEIVAGLDAARIGTFHSLCAEILRSHPAEAGVDPRFAVLDDGRASLLRRQAVDEALARAAEDPELVPLFGLLGELKLRDTLDKLQRRRLDAAEVFARQPDDLLAHWQAGLAERQGAALAALLASPNWRDAAAILENAAANQADDRMEIQRRTAIAALRDSCMAQTAGDLAGRLDALAPLGRINLRGGSGKAWPGGKDQVDQVRAALEMLRESWKSATVLQLVLTAQDEELAAAMPRLRACFRFADERYESLKRARQALDFDDLEAGALALLEAPQAHEARARWQAETAALLVDEFQDTNGRQLRLVRCLAGDCGKRFIVGDAKQSIYRFRGADVAVFREERAAIASAGGAVVSLATSYRAHGGLIACLNELLRPVLGEAGDAARPWVEPFAPLRHHRETAGPGFDPPHVELHLALGSKAGGGLARAADALAARLTALVGCGEVQVKEQDRTRPLEWGDIAILCRASSSFVAYENALERGGIPFLTVAGRGFYDRPEIRDLRNALAALADPGDDLALAGLLRSPALALSDAGLYWLSEASKHPQGRPSSLWQTLRTAGLELAGEDGSRAARAAALIADLHGQAGRAPVADLLKAFLDATGYRPALIAAGQARAARNVAKLLADAHASGLVSVGEFLAYVAELRDSSTREGEARATAEGAVQIMTVHAAKGLEFPVVAIGDVTHSPPGSNDVLLDPDLGVLLARRDDDKQLPAAYRLGKLAGDDKEAAESDRLLYVAATRAREKLILSGHITAKSDGTPSGLNNWLGRLSASGALDLAGMQVVVAETDPKPLSLDLAAGDNRIGCQVYGASWSWQSLGRVPVPPAEGAVPLPPPLLVPVAAELVGVDSRLAEQERDPGQRVWRVVPEAVRPRAPAWVVGKLVHAALAAWRFPDADGLFQRWAEAQSRGYGLTDARQLGDAVGHSRKLLLRFRGHPLYALMARAEQRLHEVQYSLAGEDGQVENGIVDALYLRDGVWTIVEFKTDHVRDAAELGQLLAHSDYLVQTQRYAAAVERLLSSRPEVALCLLDFAGGIHVHR